VQSSRFPSGTGEGRVGSRGEVAKPNRDGGLAFKAIRSACPIGAPSEHSSKEGASASSEPRVFDETRAEVGAPQQVATPAAFMKRQRVISPPGLRKTTPRARVDHRGPRSKAHQDRCRPTPHRSVNERRSRRSRSLLVRACGREPEARGRRQAHTTRAARRGVFGPLGERGARRKPCDHLGRLAGSSQVHVHVSRLHPSVRSIFPAQSSSPRGVGAWRGSAVRWTCSSDDDGLLRTG
jgi:hypothetical protein